MTFQGPLKLIRNTLLFGTTAAIAWAGFIPLSHSVEFPSTGGRGGPANTTGGGVRGACNDGQHANTSVPSITPLMPINQDGEYEHTLAEDSITLFFYVSGNVGQYAAIYVENSQTGEVVFDSKQVLPRGGLVQVSFPAFYDETEAPLVLNQAYRWDFAIVCDDKDRSLDVYKSGLLTRRDSPLPELSDLRDWSLETANRYAQAHLWQESWMILAYQKCDETEEWQEFLQSVGINAEIAEATLSECQAAW